MLGQELNASTKPMAYIVGQRLLKVQSLSDADAGQYRLQLRSSFNDYSTRFSNVFQDFEIEKADPCSNPVSLTASNTVDQQYYLADDKLVYQLQPFTVDPPDCDIDYELSQDGSSVVGAILEDGPTFTFYNDQDIDLAGQDVTFQIKGITGSAEATATIVVKMLNPCMSP